eukprot:984563-Amphidinium_carterae.2
MAIVSMKPQSNSRVLRSMRQRIKILKKLRLHLNGHPVENDKWLYGHPVITERKRALADVKRHGHRLRDVAERCMATLR